MPRQEFKEADSYKLKAGSFPKVFVGLSGGVDSSVAAALLQKDGCDVTGVFIKIWSPEWLGCTSKEDRLDAMRVCAKLSIPFLEIDLTEEYKKEVVDYMIREYKVGRTPNPDVMCNRYIKFGAFFEWALQQGADFVATGHYSQIENVNIKMKNDNSKFKITNTEFLLKVADDKNKDQTYFLWTLTQRELSRTLFPIGHLTKPEVRRIAKKFGLPTAEKKDSQGLCFVGPVDVKEFLRAYIPPRRGDILNTAGDTIGWHDGAEFVTIGERHGFHLSVDFTRTKHRQGADVKRVYVVGRDVKKNTITVAEEPQKEKEILVQKVAISNVNWTGGNVPPDGTRCSTRYRYRQELQEVSIMNYEAGMGGGKAKIHNLRFIIQFRTPQAAMSLGQSLVLYDGDVCLGGGVISSMEYRV